MKCLNCSHLWKIWFCFTQSTVIMMQSSDVKQTHIHPYIHKTKNEIDRYRITCIVDSYYLSIDKNRHFLLLLFIETGIVTVYEHVMSFSICCDTVECCRCAHINFIYFGRHCCLTKFANPNKRTKGKTNLTEMLHFWSACRIIYYVVVLNKNEHDRFKCEVYSKSLSCGAIYSL